MIEKSDHDILVELHGALMGTNGQGGLCRQVEKNTKAIAKMWVILAILIVSAGGGIYGVVELLAKVGG